MNAYYIESITRAVNYIEKNLNNKINLNGISEASGLSKFHFHRIFQAFTGDTVYDTIIRIKIEYAAKLLLSTSKTVSEISRISGFSNTTEFGRVFRDRFAVSPSAWRKTKTGPEDALSKIDDYPLIKPAEAHEDLRLISSEIRKVDGFSIAYIRHTGAYAGDSALFIFLYNKLTSWAASKNLLSAEAQNIIVYHDPVQITEEPRTKISMGISLPDDIKTGGDIGKMQLKGGDYLVNRLSLRDEEYGSAWNHIYCNLLPQHKVKPAEGFSFELYPNGEKSKDRHSSIVDIYVPINYL